MSASEAEARKEAEDLREKLANNQEELNTQLQSKTR